jgi:hypothetical protein
VTRDAPPLFAIASGPAAHGQPVAGAVASLVIRRALRAPNDAVPGAVTDLRSVQFGKARGRWTEFVPVGEEETRPEGGGERGLAIDVALSESAHLLLRGRVSAGDDHAASTILAQLRAAAAGLEPLPALVEPARWPATHLDPGPSSDFRAHVRHPPDWTARATADGGIAIQGPVGDSSASIRAAPDPRIRSSAWRALPPMAGLSFGREARDLAADGGTRPDGALPTRLALSLGHRVWRVDVVLPPLPPDSPADRRLQQTVWAILHESTLAATGSGAYP